MDQSQSKSASTTLTVRHSLFTEHPASVGETYFQHLASAGYFAGNMLFAGLACLAHGLLPFWFKSTGSEVVAKLYDRMIENRHRSPGTPSE